MNRGKICLKFLFVVLFSMIILFISCNNENKENTLNTNGGETIINNSLETKKENDLIKINDNQTEENPENKEENEKPVGDNPEEKPIGDNPEEKSTGDNPENKEQGDQPTP